MYIPEGNHHKIRSPCTFILVLVVLPSLSSSFVEPREWTRVSRASHRGVASECEREQEKPEHVCATCRRRHARARTLATSDSLSLFFSLLFFFFFYTHVSPLFSSIDGIDNGHTFTRRESPRAIDPISSRFRSSIMRQSRMLRSVPRVRGKRRHVQRLPTSMMQLAFNPHSRILELNSTVRCRTGSRWRRNYVPIRICCFQNTLIYFGIYNVLHFWNLSLKLARRNNIIYIWYTKE